MATRSRLSQCNVWFSLKAHFVKHFSRTFINVDIFAEFNIFNRTGYEDWRMDMPSFPSKLTKSRLRAQRVTDNKTFGLIMQLLHYFKL